MNSHDPNFCSMPSCSNQVVNDSERCILHSEKSQEILSKQDCENFFRLFLEYIENIVTKSYSYFQKDLQLLKEYIANPSPDIRRKFLRDPFECELIIDYINFPNRYERDEEDYWELIKNFSKIKFKKCIFYNSGFGKVLKPMSFEYCEFKYIWEIYNHLSFSDKDAMYSSCIFHCNVNTVSESIFHRPIFKFSKFKGNLHLINSKFESSIFDLSVPAELEISELRLTNSTFNSSINLLTSKIQHLNVNNSVFNKEFNLRNSEIENILWVENKNNAKFSITNSKIDTCKISNCTFNGILDIDKTFFNKNGDVTITYCEFKDFVNFKSSVFTNGLSLEDINYLTPPNFLYSKINSSKTSRETHRIIKDSFDKTGNFIEANKYYAEEMNCFTKELKDKKISSTKLLFNLYKIFSYFGQSISRPVLWIIVLAVIVWLLQLGKKSNLLYFFKPLNPMLEDISFHLNGIAKSIIPFKNILITGMEFISFFFYIIFTSLFWLIVLAIKRKTKR